MTDNRPEPRTEAGRRMLRRRSYWSGNDDIRAAILAIEAEAAQGAAPGDYHRDRVARERQDPEYDAEYRAARSERAAPRAEGLQPDTPASQFADRLAEALDKEWDAFLIEGEPSLNFGDYAERVAVRLCRPSEGAAPRAEGLDVERLERAMRVSLDIYGWPLDEMAADIAAEYARLSRPSDERVPESEEPLRRSPGGNQ